MVGEIKSNLPQLIARYLPKVSEVPLFQGISWEPVWKAQPFHPLFKELLEDMFQARKAAKKVPTKPVSVRSCFTVLPYELLGYTELMQLKSPNTLILLCPDDPPYR